jgi:hypothetical protein
MSEQTKRFERRIVVACVLEAVVLMPALWMFVQTENVLWIIGGAVIGSLPVLYVIFTNSRSTSAPKVAQSGGASIVEDSRERR